MKSKELIEKSLKKNSTQQLVSKIDKLNSSSVEFEVIISILEKRNFDVSKWKVETSVDQVSESIKDEIHEIIKEESIDLTPTLRDKLIEDVDHLVDELIASKRTGVYTEVMKALGGQYDSDIDELFEKATEEQLRDALVFQNMKQNAEQNKKTIKKVNEVIKNDKIKKSEKQVDRVSAEFTVALNSKKAPGETLTGVVISDFVCHKAKKRFFKIKTDKGVFLKKADLCKII